MSLNPADEDLADKVEKISIPLGNDLVCGLPENLTLSDVQSSCSTLYEPLLEEYSFRLLILHPSPSRDAPITCSLITGSLKDDINYTALSYEWGNPNPPKHILVNGKEVSVTPSLHLALTHLRGHTPGLLWIDALCINQSDIQERGHQVARMRDIYSKAHHVVSWLGPASPTLYSDDLAAVRRDIHSRNYWTRAWIIQEFVLAKTVILMCGDVAFLDHDQDYKSQNNRRLLPFKQLRENQIYLTASSVRRNLFTHYCQLRNVRTRGHLDLTEVISLGANSDALDPRDNVYAVLGLLQPEEVAGIEIDYTFSPCEVFCATLEVLDDSNRCASYLEVPVGRRKIDHYKEFAQRKREEPLEQAQNNTKSEIKYCQGTCGTKELLSTWGLARVKGLQKSGAGQVSV